MLAPLEAVAAAAVAPIDNAQKSANATAARAPADLPMANQQTGVPTTLNHPAGTTTLPGAVDLKTDRYWEAAGGGAAREHGNGEAHGNREQS